MQGQIFISTIQALEDKMTFFDSGYSKIPGNITPKFPIPDTPTVGSLVDIGAGANLITGSFGGGHPLCDKNLLKDIDGVMSMSTMPSLPDLDAVLSATGLNNIAEKLDPDAMFSGIPTLTELPAMFGIPNIDEIDWENEAKAAADDVLSQLNISNPLDDLCAQLQEGARSADGLINQIPDPSPNINNMMPNIDLPKFNDIVDIPEVGDLF